MHIEDEETIQSPKVKGQKDK